MRYWPPAIVAAVMFLFGSPALSSKLEGTSVSELTTRFGVASPAAEPNTIIHVPTPVGHLHLLVREGVVIRPTTSDAAPTVVDAALSTARKLVAERNYVEAGAVLNNCVARQPRNKKCRSLLADVQTEVRRQANDEITASQGDLFVAVTQLRRYLEVDPENVEVRQKYEQARKLEEEQSEAAEEWLLTAEEKTRLARESMASQHYARTLQLVAPLQMLPAAKHLMQQTMVAARLELIRQCESAKDLTALKEVVDVLQTVNPHAPEAMRPLFLRAREAALNLIIGKSRSPAAIRYADEVLSRELPAVRSGEGLRLTARITFDSSCTAAQQSAITDSLKPIAIIAEDAPNTLAVTSCESTVARIATRAKNSTYVAGQNQVVNADYVRAQQNLNEAVAAQAQNEAMLRSAPATDTTTAVLQGLSRIAAQAAVDKARAKVNSTAPYLSEPIVDQYVASEVTWDRNVTISGEVDGVYVETRITDTANTFENVLPGDTQGLVASSPTFRATSQSEKEASDNFARKVEPLLRKSITAGYLTAARRTVNSNRIESIGNLLFARDVTPSGTELVGLARVYRSIDEDPVGAPVRVLISASDFPDLSQPTRMSKHTAQGSRAHDEITRALSGVAVVETSTKLGSAFAVSNEYLVTNEHVVNGAANVKLHFADGSTLPAKVVKTSARYDLALLQVNGGALHPLELGDSDDLAVGNEVYAAGSPQGLEGSVTKGIVSAFREVNGESFVQTDAAINHGNSGGPLLTSTGRVIGVNTWKTVETEGIGFAVPVNVVKVVFFEYLRASK